MGRVLEGQGLSRPAKCEANPSLVRGSLAILGINEQEAHGPPVASASV